MCFRAELEKSYDFVFAWKKTADLRGSDLDLFQNRKPNPDQGSLQKLKMTLPWRGAWRKAEGGAA
jgi:hypothetical protein